LETEVISDGALGVVEFVPDAAAEAGGLFVAVWLAADWLLDELPEQALSNTHMMHKVTIAMTLAAIVRFLPF